jgi:hypothetical protein
VRGDAACALLLLAAGCGGDPQAAELACQRRLVGAFEPAPGGSEMAAGFAALGRRLDAVDTAGCNEHQAHSARAIADLSRRIEGTLRRLAPLRERVLEPSPVERQPFNALMAMIEQFERRRAVLVEELRRMQGESSGADAANAT